MQVAIHNADIFSVTEADSLALPIDGNGPNMVGNLAREAFERFEVTCLEEMLAPPPYYPLNGEPIWSSLETFDTHFEWLCCLDTLSHKDGADHKANLRKTLDLAFDGMSCGGVGRSLACPLLTGGNRISPVDAAYLMLAVAEKWRDWPFELHVVERDPERFGVLQQVVR